MFSVFNEVVNHSLVYNENDKQMHLIGTPCNTTKSDNNCSNFANAVVWDLFPILKNMKNILNVSTREDGCRAPI